MCSYIHAPAEVLLFCPQGGNTVKFVELDINKLHPYR